MNEEHSQSEDLVVIFRAPDEVTANIVYGLLESEGIDAMVQPRRNIWAGQAALIGTFPSDRHWGDILVFERDAERSRKLIEASYGENSEGELVEREWSSSSPAPKPMMFIVATGSLATAGYILWAGYSPWLIAIGIAGLILCLQGIAVRNRAPVQFRRATTIYSYAYLPGAVAILGTAVADRLDFETSIPLLVLMCLLGTALFVYAAFPNALGGEDNEQ